MDLDTENRVASILLKEAAELRRQAQQDGVRAYLHKPTVRGRPNSRFLSATIRGIEQGGRDPKCEPPVENKNHKSGLRKLIILNHCKYHTNCSITRECWCCMQWPGNEALCYSSLDECHHCCVPP